MPSTGVARLFETQSPQDEQDEQWGGFFVLQVAAVVASFFAATYLFVTLQRLPKYIGAGRRVKGIMARQLLHLALADMVDSLIAIPYLILREVVKVLAWKSSGTLKFFSVMCQIVDWHNVGFMVSLLVELHIALATTCAIFGHSKALKNLSKTLVLVWPFGLALGAPLPILDHPRWNSTSTVCRPRSYDGERFRAIVILVALVVVSFTYMLGHWRIVSSGAGAERYRFQGRSGVYLLVAVIGWGPCMILWATGFGGASKTEDWYDVISAALLGSNGWMNAVIYAGQSQFRRRTLPPPTARAPDVVATPDASAGCDTFNDRRLSALDVERRLTALDITENTELESNISVVDLNLENDMFYGLFGTESVAENQ